MSKIYYYDYLYSKNSFTKNQKNIINQLGHELIEINYTNYEEELIDKNPTNSIIILNWVENASGIKKHFIQYFNNWRYIINTGHKKNNNKFIFVYHNLSNYYLQLSNILFIHEYIKNLFKRTFIKYLLKECDAIQLLCNNSINYINNSYRNKSFIIPHSTYINTYGQIVKNKNVEYLNLLLFGMIKKYKNIETIIKVAEKLKNEKIKFIICGSVSDDKYYKQIVEMSHNLKNIEFIPKFIPDEKIPDLFSKCDALVLTHHKNSCLNSGVMILAASYQKTFICSPIAAAKDMPQNLIYMYDYKNNKTHIKNLQDEIMKMYNDKRNNPNILIEKGQQLQNYLIENHSEQIIIERYRKMFDFLNNKKD